MAIIRAPELAPALAWINTARPLTLAELRGHVVILDFWTYCCVNCLHALRILGDLEVRHARDPVVVIGIHSAKFATEAKPERIAEAVARHRVRHPVVVDEDMQIWERYAIRAWPTLVVLSTDGAVAAVAPGEPSPVILEQFVTAELDAARAAGTLAAGPFAAPPPTSKVLWVGDGRAASSRRRAAGPGGGASPAARTDRSPGALAFPGKVAVETDGRIAVSDSGHHRVLVLAPDGEVRHAIGSGSRGLVEGPFGRARLDDPQGMAWDGNLLWICDAGAHVLWRADFLTGQLSVMAGTGRLGTAPIARQPQPGRARDLRSPWDVVVDDTRLYLALAGSHQLAVYDKVRQTVAALAGSGREGLVDGGLHEACLAQPSGLSLVGRRLYVADSEASALRVADLAREQVETLLGSGLFYFGLRDGALEDAQLQHPLAVVSLGAGELALADTYNDAVRVVDLARAVVETLYHAKGDRGLREPGGLALLPGGDLLVADTGRHRLVRLTRAGAFAGSLSVRGAPPALEAG